MEAYLEHLAQQTPTVVLFLAIAAALYILSLGADLLVDEAVALAERWRMPKMLIGATVVSLGTTLPECAVSVMAALRGQPALAMGNAVGSIICDTALILGLAAILIPLPLNRLVLRRQGNVQLFSAIALVLFSLFTAADGGRVFPQWAGWIFVAALAAYLYGSLRWARADNSPIELPDETGARLYSIIAKFALGATLVILSSQMLIVLVQEAALRLGIPQAIIAATLVAFGTSLPELTTAMSAIRKGHAELAVGNVIGADVLNALFVVGVSASVTTGGLAVDPRFFKLLFPAMLLALVTFRIGARLSKDKLHRSTGFILVAIYIATTTISYLLP